MRKYLLATLVATIASLSGNADGFIRPQVLFNTSEEAVVNPIEERFGESRQNLDRLAGHNALVLQRFDQLEVSLKNLYQDEHQLSADQVKIILDALDFAAEKHQFQMRKNEAKTPYISHPIGVTNYLINVGKVKDPALIIASLLHDTVQDTQTTLEEISRLFGSEVAGYVAELTDDKELSPIDRKRLQVINATHKSSGAAQIKLADKLYNLNDLLRTPPKTWSRERIDLYFEWVEAVVNRLPLCNPDLKQAVDQTIHQYWESQDKN